MVRLRSQNVKPGPSRSNALPGVCLRLLHESVALQHVRAIVITQAHPGPLLRHGADQSFKTSLSQAVASLLNALSGTEETSHRFQRDQDVQAHFVQSESI